MQVRAAWRLALSVACACGTSDDSATARDPSSPFDVSRSAEPQPPANAPTRVIDGTVDDGHGVHEGGGGNATSNERACGGRRSAPGELDRNVVSGGAPRHYRVFVPPNAGERPLPMVLSFHGLTEDGAHNRATTGYDALGAVKGFITVYLDGHDRSWNAGVCCDPSSSSKVDDVRFVSETLATLTSELCVDERRVYASGFSNGGFLSYRLACELGDRIAAIGVVGATMPVAACNPPRAVPIMHVHGTYDPVVPMGGNSVLGFPATEDVIAGWVARNRCESGPHDGLRAANGSCRVWDQCANAASVTYCRLERTGHVWTGGSGAFPTTEALWNFLSQQSL